MQLTINFPDVLPSEKFAWYVQQIENLLRPDHIPVEIHQESVSKSDPWDALNPDEIAVDTGIPDFAEQHDHYLYHLPLQTQRDTIERLCGAWADDPTIPPIFEEIQAQRENTHSQNI